jgi:hypothetical protein
MAIVFGHFVPLLPRTKRKVEINRGLTPAYARSFGAAGKMDADARRNAADNPFHV